MLFRLGELGLEPEPPLAEADYPRVLSCSVSMPPLHDLDLYKLLAAKGTHDAAIGRLVACVDECFEEAVQRTKTVISHMPQYTLHDEVHLLRVVEIMGLLIPPQTREQLQPLELAGLMLSAAYHDIGMAPAESDVRALLSAAPGATSEDQQQYLALREAHQSLLQRQTSLQLAGRHFEAQEIEAGLLAEYLRSTHAARARALLFQSYSQKLIYDNYAFCARLAEVCFSHNEDPSSLQAIPCHELVRARAEYCNWRFVACVLRLADILDFDPKRTPHVLFEHLGIRDPVSIKEWKKHRAVAAWDIQPRRIAFAAQCPDPVIEKCIRDFIRMVERELHGTHNILSGMYDSAAPDLATRYALNLPFEVSSSDIRPEIGFDGPRYEYLDIGFSLDEERITSLLMGLNLYRTPILFLRELLQNAVDACRHRAALHQRHPELGAYAPCVDVRIKQQDDRHFVEIEDNGMGMDDHIVRTYFARIGRSYYSSSDFLQDRARFGLSFQPVSQFGIGVLSVFMVGDALEVQTRRLADGSIPIAIQIGSQGSLFWFNKGTRSVAGTCMRVRLTQEPSKLWVSSIAKQPPTLKSTVAALAPHTHVPIYVTDEGNGRKNIAETWASTDGRFSLCSPVDIELSPEEGQGFEGRVRVHILRNFSKKVTDHHYPQEDGEDSLLDYFQHRWSYIEKVHVDRSEKTGLTQGYSVHVSSGGRWSQHGFAVRQGLFYSSSQWGRHPEPPYVPFPFPVSYDLNILPPVALPLTADRNRIVLSDEAIGICSTLAEKLSMAFFRSLGAAKVRQHRGFFESMATLGKHEGTPFLQTLKIFLGV